MSELQPIHVAVGLLLDEQQPGQVWIFRRRVHENVDEWQLPGKKFEFAEGEIAAEALGLSLESKFGIDSARIDYLKTEEDIWQGDAIYTAHYHEVTGFRFSPLTITHNLYGAAKSVNPLRRHLGLTAISPITRHAFDALIRGTRCEPDGMLLRGNPIQ